MAEENENSEGARKNNREEIFSKAVRAGKRTYFFDVKATRRNDYYLIITESKKRFNRDGRFYFEKHKLFLYKEDFDKFSGALEESIGFIKEANPQLLDPEDVEYKQAETDQAKPESKDVKEPEKTEEVAEGEETNAEEKDEQSKDKHGKDEKKEESINQDYTNVDFEDLDDSKSE